MRKKWIGTRTMIAVITTLVLILTACSGGSDSDGDAKGSPPSASSATPSATGASPDSKEPVELTISWWGGDARHQAIQDAIKLFEQKHDRITVKPTFSGFDGYGDKLTVQLSTGGAPDVFMFSRALSQQFGKSDVLLNLNDYRDHIPYLADVEPYMDSPYYRYEDKLLGLASGITANIVVYNKKVYDEAQVQYPTDDETWLSLGDKWKAVHQVNGKIYGDAGWYDMPDTFALIMKQLGKEVYNGDAAPPTATVNTEEAKRIWSWVEELWASGALPRDSSDTIGFEAGNLATALSASSVLPTTVTQTQDPLGFATMPKTFDGSGSKVSMPPVPAGLWGVAKETKHPEEALLLINFLLTDPEAIAVLQVNNGVPAVPSAQQHLIGLLAPDSIDKAMVDIVARTQQGADEYWLPDQPIGKVEADAAFTTQMENFIFKGVNLEGFLAAADADMNAALKIANP